MYAHLLLESGYVDQSRRAYSEIVQDHQWEPTAQYQYGRVLAASGELNAALQAFERACELYPAYAEAHYAAAQAYRTLGQRDKAGYHLRQHQNSRSGMPSFSDPVLERVRALAAGAQVHIRNAAELERAGQLRQSVAANLRALQIDPASVQAHVNLISLYGRLGDFEAAEHHYFKATELQPPHAGAYYNYGVLAFSRKEYSAARQAFEQALRINSNHVEAHNNLGFLLDFYGKSKEALKHFKRAIEIQPGHQLASYHLGRILIRQGQPKAAIQYLAQAIGQADTEYTAELLHALATAHVRSGDLHAARKYTRAAYRSAVTTKQQDVAERVLRDLLALDKRLRQ
jgi:tetratricopeptide (TPR) repeat protein